MNLIHFSIFVLTLIFSSVILHGNSISIDSIKFHKEKNSKGIKITSVEKDEAGNNQIILVPFIEISISTKRQICFTSICYAKAYFFNSSKQLVECLSAPAMVERPSKGTYSTPAFFKKNSSENIYFTIPKSLRGRNDWSVVVVFGDQNEITASVYPSGNVSDYCFYEKSLLGYKGKGDDYKGDSNPIIEYSITTKVNEYPKMTFLLLLSEKKKADGVFVACLLAKGIEDMKKKIISPSYGSELYNIIQFAKRNNMAIICWGAKRLWDPNKNWDEFSTEEYKYQDKNLDSFALSWKRGIERLCKNYDLPSRQFLLWGTSGAAQHAMRLALRCPNYFLAVCLHIPSSFDKPQTDASKVLWCLTTGELEPGYYRSLLFYRAAVSTGYPIIYKALPKLGHREHTNTSAIALGIFKYAWEQRFRSENVSWQEILAESKYYGDVINQEVIKRKELDEMHGKEQILVTPLPNEQIRDLWNRN